jgi:hypothetical protein
MDGRDRAPRVCSHDAYGLLLLVDGWDGHRGPGLPSDLGHTLFFVAFVLLSILAVGLRRLIPSTVSFKRIVANVATVAACFLWVSLGDLFARLRVAAPLPDPWRSPVRSCSGSEYSPC